MLDITAINLEVCVEQNTMADLRKFARDMGIAFGRNTTKASILADLKQIQDEQRLAKSRQIHHKTD